VEKCMSSRPYLSTSIEMIILIIVDGIEYPYLSKRSGYVDKE
jgi:hypothetical protein